ncbi:hypothetical protein LINGRAHAP2_LOCUS4287 [Linum grandiflorum]
MLALLLLWTLKNSWASLKSFKRKPEMELPLVSLSRSPQVRSWFLCSGDDLEVLIKIDQEEPSRWVWVTEEMVHGNVEEYSGIDNESYVVINENQVVDAVATFMAKCITANPKSQKLSPEELQKAVTEALAGGSSKLERAIGIWHAGQLFYALSTWGVALVGLYKTRAVLKVAAMGIHSTSKVVLRAL